MRSTPSAAVGLHTPVVALADHHCLQQARLFGYRRGSALRATAAIPPLWATISVVRQRTMMADTPQDLCADAFIAISYYLDSFAPKQNGDTLVDASLVHNVYDGHCAPRGEGGQAASNLRGAGYARRWFEVQNHSCGRPAASTNQIEQGIRTCLWRISHIEKITFTSGAPRYQRPLHTSAGRLT